MLERLAAAVEEMEVPVDGPTLAAALAVLDRLTAKVVAGVGAFDAAGGWEVEGATSMTAWLRYHGALAAGQAGSMVRTAGLLRSLPVVREAWAGGRLSGGQVQAVAANVRPATVGLLAEQEASVVAAVEDLSVADTAAAMQHWARCAEALVDGVEAAEPARALHVSTTLAGRVELSGSLDPEGGAVVAAAVRVAATGDADGEPVRGPAERRADALVDVCRWFLDHQHRARGGRRRPHLNVIVDLHHLAATASGGTAGVTGPAGGRGTGGTGGTGDRNTGPDGAVGTAGGRHTGGRAGLRAGGRLVDGPALDAVTVDRLLCDAALHRVLTAGRSAILDYGTTTRTVPAPLWAAVVVRDRHCRFPGCDRSPGWCEAHHVTPVAAGGPTNLDNLVLLCTRHHHRCHHPGWHTTLHPDATLHITTPTGQHLTSRPPPPPPEPPAPAPDGPTTPSEPQPRSHERRPVATRLDDGPHPAPTRPDKGVPRRHRHEPHPPPTEVDREQRPTTTWADHRSRRPRSRSAASARRP